jgi:16S rRNA (cytosine967-C5)-methyltransferase
VPTAEPPRRGSGARARSRQRPSERTRTGDPARLAAYRLLRAVDEGAYANLELPRILRAARVGGRDAAFATELAYGAIRLRGRYDPILAIAAARKLSAVDPPVLDVLRIGAHQLLGMRVAAHAAVSETVALARQVTGAGAAGFVNAVLRRVGERRLDEWLELVAPASLEPGARLAIRESHPLWVVSAWRDALLGHGRSDRESVAKELASVLAADNEPPRVTLVARPGLATTDELVAAGATTRGRWAPTAVILPSGDPGQVAAVREGRAAVQDEGSQLVALALAAAPVTGQNGPDPARERWLDLCAGPGGKAGLLAALAVQRGADFVANEVNLTRAELVRQTLRAAAATGRAGQVKVRTGDGRDVGGLEPAAYDRVLVDAPCTGLGALRRRPEARWRRTPADLAPLTALQAELLASAVEATRPGGVVAYATCSPHLAETVFVVRDLLRRRPDVEQLDTRQWLRDRDSQPLPSTGAGPAAQLWPDLHGTDGMFLALLRRRG